MGINLIDKIVPKNNAFRGMVDSDQVVTKGVAGNLVGFGAEVLADTGVTVRVDEVGTTPNKILTLKIVDSDGDEAIFLTKKV